jgi:hypothetical protein
VSGAGNITAVKYNNDITEPVNAGIYVVSVDVSEGENFDATFDLPIDTLVILRAEPTINLIAYSMDTAATYNAEPHIIEVGMADGVTGLGNITAKYNGSEQAINAGAYTITAVIEQGQNYNAASFLLPITLTVNKGILSAEHFTFPRAVPLRENEPSTVNVTLASPYTGAGQITVKYNGSIEPPTKAGYYLLSVSVQEGSNFFATEEDIILDSILIAKMQTVTVRIVNENGYLLLSPAFTVVINGDFINDSIVTSNGKAVFENVLRGGSFVISAFGDNYDVEEKHLVSLQNDTVIELIATPSSSSIDKTNISDKKSIVYIKHNVLYVQAPYNYDALLLYNGQGVNVYSSRETKSSYSTAGLKSGLYIAVLYYKGQRKEAVKVLNNAAK